MTQTGICEAATPLLAKIDGIHQLLRNQSHLANRSGLINLRRQCESAMIDLKFVRDGLAHKSVQEELSRLQSEKDGLRVAIENLQTKAAEPEAEEGG